MTHLPHSSVVALVALGLAAGCRAPAAPAATPVASHSAAETDAPTIALAERLQAAAEAWHAAGLFDGAILVADGGEVVWQGAFGPADRGEGRDNTVKTRFPIASLTKQFTAVLVMMQVERGTLRLDQTISDVLPWYRADTGARITLRDLLSHTSGLPDVDPAVYLLTEPKAAQSRWLVETHGSGELQFEPGKNFAYTNTDYHVLTAILEETTGQSFEALLSAEVLDPLGMTDTGIARRGGPREGRARDYVLADGTWVDAPAFRWENWQGAGAMVSTLADLHRWNRALAGHELVNEDTWTTMLTPRTDLPGGNYVALGSWVYPRQLPNTDHLPTLIERRGAIGGYAVLNVLVAGDDRWIVLLANHYNEGIHSLPYARCLPLDLLLVLFGTSPQGPQVGIQAP